MFDFFSLATAATAKAGTPSINLPSAEFRASAVTPDNPIATDKVAYLTTAAGTTWTASRAGGEPLGCEFVSDSDLKPIGGTDSGTEKQGVGSQEACCNFCWNEGLCQAAVFVPSSASCWLKTADDIAGGAYPKAGVTACMRKRGAPPPELTIPAVVPGDLITDLQAAGQIGDPLYEKNFLNASIWDRYNWTYRASFAIDEPPWNMSQLLLVFDGIKMGAKILVNGHQVGEAVDQFVRYSFNLLVPEYGLSYGSEAPNILEVTFDPSINVGGRFMACTGGWDWAAYSHTYQGGAHTFSKGIWKAVYLATSMTSGAAITDVVPQVFYTGAYPVEPLVEKEHGGFRVDVRVFLSASRATAGILSLTPSWDVPEVSHFLNVPAGESNATLTLYAPADKIALWWPVGMGDQPLYNVSVRFAYGAGAGTRAVESTRTIGFRYAALVTGNDTDPAYVDFAAKSEGTSTHGMYFRVNVHARLNASNERRAPLLCPRRRRREGSCLPNLGYLPNMGPTALTLSLPLSLTPTLPPSQGAVILAKGANTIPMEELEGRLSDAAHVALVEAAVGARFNMLRVWGGGMFLPEAFYNACDALGVLVYHDMQYAQEGHAPSMTLTQEMELRHMVRRLASHTAIIIWDGCNECQVVMDTPTGIYATFVMTLVAEEDASRSVWPSCPAKGWSTGVRMLDALPNGNTLTTPKEGPTIETHGPYQHGSGFPAVNGNKRMQLFDPNIPIKVATGPTGPTLPNVFASEFGAIQYSSFESMASTLAPEHWALHGGQPYDTCEGGFASQCEGVNVMAERNYPCDSLINVYFGMHPDSYFNTTGEVPFKRQLYQCLLSSALNIKQDIETRRSKNELGILVWQFNEIWPTGGWGSIEYGTPVAGQVLGGRWKPLHYFYQRSIYADLMASCGHDGACFVKNDMAGLSFFGDVEVSSLTFTTGEVTKLTTQTLQLDVGAGTSARFTVDLSGVANTTHMLFAAVYPYCDGAHRCSDEELAAQSRGTTRPLAAVGMRAVRAGGGAASFNEILLAPPKDLVLPKASVTATVAPSPKADGTIDIVLDATATALYVTLTTLAQGRFSDNAFALVPGQTNLSFIPIGVLDRAVLEKSLRVEHLADHL